MGPSVPNLQFVCWWWNSKPNQQMALARLTKMKIIVFQQYLVHHLMMLTTVTTAVLAMTNCFFVSSCEETELSCCEVKRIYAILLNCIIWTKYWLPMALNRWCSFGFSGTLRSPCSLLAPVTWTDWHTTLVTSYDITTNAGAEPQIFS